MTSRLSEVLQSIPTKEVNEFYQFAVKYGIVDLALYPLDLGDTLIRLGYEPFPPVEREGFFRGKSLSLPSLPVYVYYLYMIDGYSGLYRGAIPYVTSSLINRHLSKYIEDLSPFPPDPPEGEPRMTEKFTEKNVTHFLQQRAWKLISKVITIHASYPFHALGVRAMARFVTSGTTQEGYRPALKESWFDELLRVRDFSEFFAGCQAKLLREIVFTVISVGSFLAVMRIIQILRPDPQQADTIENSVEYLGNSLGAMYTSPFKNASDIMIINKTDIPLGNPPFIEPFTTCWDCITNLRQDRFWKHAPFMNRTYVGPTDVVQNQLFPRNTMFGPVFYPGPEYHGIEDVPNFLHTYYEVWKKLGVQPGTNVRSIQDIFMEPRMSGAREGSMALQGPRALLSERHVTPFLASSYNLLGGTSNPFRI